MEETEENHKCPVCFELPVFEIFQCHAGHVLCAACYSKVLFKAVENPQSHVAKCPQCRVPYEPNRPIRNRAMELMLDNLSLMSFPCPHREFGCPTLGRRAAVREHSKNCDFSKSIKLCEMLGYDCEYSMELSDVAGSSVTTIHHLTSTHNFKLIPQNGANIYLREWDKTGVPSVDISWTPVIFKLGGGGSSSFALVYARTDKQEQPCLSVSCMLLQSGEIRTPPLADIEACFKIFSTSSTTVESLSWKVSPVVQLTRQTKQLSPHFPTKSLALEPLRSNFVWDNMIPLEVGFPRMGGQQVVSPEQSPTTAGAHVFPVRKGKSPLTDFQCDGCDKWIVGVVPVKYKCLDCPGASTSICQSCMNQRRHKGLSHRLAMLLNRGQEDRLVGLWRSIPTHLQPSSSDQYLSCTCDGCGVNPAQGMMYKCIDCPGKTLCVTCVDRRQHHFLHIFVPIRNIPQVTID